MKTPAVLLYATIVSLSAAAQSQNSNFAPHSRAESVTYRPFGAYAVALRLGDGGIGGEIATPLSGHLDLRAGMQAFSYSAAVTASGVNANATLHLTDSFLTVDLRPFANGFHISPGLTLHNANSLNASFSAPSGQTFSLDSSQYISAPGDPIHGTVALTYPHKLAPRLTVGTGNLFARSGARLSFPVELGFEYLSNPRVALTLAGSGCEPEGCGPIASSDNQAQIAGEIQKLERDASPTRFFPVVSFGVAYRFGH